MKVKVQQPATTELRCDICDKEIYEKPTYSKYGTDVCHTCWDSLPPWAREWVYTLCSIQNYIGDEVSWSRLGTGIWVLWSGNEDRSSLSECGSLEEAEKAVLGMDEETDSDGYELVDIFRDGKAMGATIKRRVVYKEG